MYPLEILRVFLQYFCSVVRRFGIPVYTKEKPSNYLFPLYKHNFNKVHPG